VRTVTRIAVSTLLARMLTTWGVLLAGCGGKVAIRSEVEPITKEVRVRIESGLTTPIPVHERTDNTCGAILKQANENTSGLQVCNAKLRQIDAVEGTPVEEGR
jgi:hypothetical protein